jgi:hypothetical protein
VSIPAPEEVGQLMAVADDRFRPFIALCAFAGLRLGEAAGVQLDDVDFLRRSLKVSRQIQRVNGGAIDVRAPKYGSERVVYLADSLVNVLAERVTAHGTNGKDRWLFAGEGDDPPHQNTVGYWWRKTLRDASLTGIKLHDLRHFTVRAHRRRVRRGDRPTLARPRQGDDNPQHLRPPLADGGGPHEEGGGVDHFGSLMRPSGTKSGALVPFGLTRPILGFPVWHGSLMTLSGVQAGRHPVLRRQSGMADTSAQGGRGPPSCLRRIRPRDELAVG